MPPGRGREGERAAERRRWEGGRAVDTNHPSAGCSRIINLNPHTLHFDKPNCGNTTSHHYLTGQAV